MKLKPQVVEVPYDVNPSSRHAVLLTAVMQRFRMSHRYMSDNYARWAKQEERFRAYIPETTENALRRNNKAAGKPEYTTIHVPYDYAMLLTAHTYWTSVFLARDPVMQFRGARGQDQTAEQGVDALLNYQLQKSQSLVPLYLWLMDAPKYGLGVIGSYWAEEFEATTQIVEQPVSYFGIQTGKTKKVRETRKTQTYVGNRSYNCRPQDFFPDPRVSIARFQEGEFCGHQRAVGWNTILRRQADGFYYNIEPMKKVIDTRRTEAEGRDQGSSQIILPAGMDTLYSVDTTGSNFESEAKLGDTHKKAFPLLLEMIIELVPSVWGLGSSQYPEKFVFTIGNGQIILSIMPLASATGKFPYDVLEYEFEAYGLAKRSMLEIAAPMNESLTWLIDSHMHNVRKTLNNELVVDPSRIVMKDLMDPGAGKLVRLRPEAYGTNPAEAIHQLQIADITQGHLRDAELFMQMMQRVLGVTENVMGMIDPGGRKTATEVRTSSSFGVNRLKTQAEYFSAMGFSPWGSKWLSNARLNYSEEQIFRIVGNAIGGDKIKVTPDMLAGEFDFIAVDGTLPIDRQAQSQMWMQIAQAFMTNPQVAGSYDWPGIFGMVAQLAGVRGIENYKLQVGSPEHIQAQATAGNVVPIGAAGGNRTGTS